MNERGKYSGRSRNWVEGADIHHLFLTLGSATEPCSTGLLSKGTNDLSRFKRSKLSILFEKYSIPMSGFHWIMTQSPILKDI